MVHDGKNTTGEKDAANLEAKSIKENLKDRKSSLLGKAKKLRLPPRTFFSVASPDGFYKRLFELDSRSGSTSSAAAKVAIEIMEDAVDDAEVSDKGKGNIRKTSRGYAPKVVHKKQLIGETLEKFPKEKPVYRSSRLPSIQQVEHPADIRRKAEITYTPPGTIHQRRDTQKRRKRVSISMEPVVKSVVPEPPKITDLTTGKAILPEVLRGGSVTSMVSTQSSIATEAVVRSSKVARRGPQETQESPSGSFTRERGSGRAFRGSRTSEVSRIPRASRASRASREIPRKTEWMARELVEEMAGDTAATHDLPPLGFQYFTRDIDNLFGTQYTAEEAGEWPAPIQVRRSFFMGRLHHTCDTPWTRPEYDIIYKGGWGPYLNAEGQGRMTRPKLAMLESLYRRNTAQDMVRGILTDLVVDGGAVSASASGAAHSSMRSAVTPAATRAPAAVPLMRGSLKPLSRALERGYSARWAFGTRQPSFLYTETGLLDCDPMPSMDMWRVRRRRPRLRRPAKVVLPPLIAPVRDEDRCIKTLSAHVLPRVESASCRRRSSVRRPTFSISRERTAVKKGAYRFPTHALYQGDWHNTLRIFEGQGVYLGPHKVEYEGDFQDGMCHGAGALHYPNAAVIHGTWERGHLIQPMYISKDGLSFEPNGDYCRMPDRRYFTEVQKGLRPAGRSQLTNQHPPRRVPPGCYDAGDGIFDPRRNAVYDPDTGDVVRVPTKSEMEWIKKHCRKGWDENVGYRPDLYENWFEEPKEELEKEGEEEEWIGEVESSLKMESSEEGKLSSEELEEQEEQKPETDEAKKETGVPIHYPRILPPVAVQDVALDAAPPVNIFPRLFPETEGDVVPESTKDKLMIPIDTYIAPENMDVSGRYQAMLEDERRKQEKKEKRARERERRMAGETVEEGKKEEVESATSTPRLSLDDFDEIYKGPWRQMARRLVPLLRNRLEEDRKLAAAKWQEDLMQLLSERATHAGLEMSTSGYKGMAQPGPEEKRRTTPHSIIPPGLEERARQRRAERQERLRQEEEKRIQQQLERERRQAQAKAAVEKVASPDDERVEDEGDTPRRPPRRVSVLPSSAMAAPKGRESLAEGPMQPVSPQPVSPESPTSAAPPPKPHQRPRSSEGKKSLAFKDD